MDIESVRKWLLASPSFSSSDDIRTPVAKSMKVPPPTKAPKNASQKRSVSKTTTRKELIEEVQEEEEEVEEVAVDEEFVKTVAENSNVVAFICECLLTGSTLK